MNLGLRKILQYALQQLTTDLREMQVQIILKERFLSDAVLHTTFYKAGDIGHANSLWNDLEAKYQEKHALAHQIQDALDKDSEQEWQRVVSQMFQ